MTYCSASDSALLCQNLLSGASNFSTSTSPTLTAVNRWLSSGCSIINAKLAARGYDAPVSSAATAYDWLTDLNALYGAAKAEQSRTNITVSSGERTRGQMFERSFWEQLEELCKNDLTFAGLSRTSSGKLWAGGISITDKETYESDTDRVAPRFATGLFGFDGTLSPAGLSNASSTN